MEVVFLVRGNNVRLQKTLWFLVNVLLVVIVASVCQKLNRVFFPLMRHTERALPVVV